MGLLALEIDAQPLGAFIIILDPAETPAPVDDVGTGLHGFEFGFGRLEQRVFGDERGNSGGIHGCV